VAVWVLLSRFVQVTVPPTDTVTWYGTKQEGIDEHSFVELLFIMLTWPLLAKAGVIEITTNAIIPSKMNSFCNSQRYEVFQHKVGVDIIRNVYHIVFALDKIIRNKF